MQVSNGMSCLLFYLIGNSYWNTSALRGGYRVFVRDVDSGRNVPTIGCPIDASDCFARILYKGQLRNRFETLKFV